MKKYRKVEITTFQRRVTIVSSGPDFKADDHGFSTVVPPDSDEGRRILIDAVKLLEERLNDREAEQTDQAGA